MFGKNIPIKPIYTQSETLKIVSLFPTIQGEGPFAGMPAIFVRFAGCNLRCFFCDTDFESNPRELSISDLEQSITEMSCNVAAKLVVLTGGEPLAQPIGPLCARLIRKGLRVQIETAGTIWQTGLEQLPREALTIVCSPKTLSVHPQVALLCENWKYIIRAGETSCEDGLPKFSTQREGIPARLYRPPANVDGGKLIPGTGLTVPHRNDTVWLQPCDERGFGDDNEYSRTRANIEECVKIALKHGHRISFQLHKVLGVE